MYTGQAIDVLMGTAVVKVEHNGQSATLPLFNTRDNLKDDQCVDGTGSKYLN